MPALPGALELAVGWRSSAAGALEHRPRRSCRASCAGMLLCLICDPQTSGSLLAAVAAHQAVEIEGATRRRHHVVRVGEMIEEPARLELVRASEADRATAASLRPAGTEGSEPT
jgi:hypothetical protein